VQNQNLNLRLVQSLHHRYQHRLLLVQNQHLFLHLALDPKNLLFLLLRRGENQNQECQQNLRVQSQNQECQQNLRVQNQNQECQQNLRVQSQKQRLLL
jgi:hypothetical protein